MGSKLVGAAARDKRAALRRREAETRAAKAAVYRARAMRWRNPGAFSAFVKLVWDVVEPRRLEWAPFMDVVCHALHRQMLGDREYRRLLINIPPGHAKSLLVSVLAPAYEWTFNPGRRKVYFSGDDSLSKRDSRRTRILLKSPLYQELLGAVCAAEGREPWTFATDQDQKVNYENTDRGFRQCLTLRAGVTGKRGDDFVIDDPLDVKAVTVGAPDTIRKRCAEAQGIIDQALQTRVNDLRDARQTLIMQRLHPEDPSAHAIRDGDWKVICLPLHFDPEHPHACPDDPRTEAGELLHPDRYPVEEVARLVRKLGTAQAQAQLEQRPIAASGGMIKRHWFRERYGCTPQEIAQQAKQVWVSIDAAKKGNESNDFHALQVWARKDDKRYLLDRFGDRVDYPEFERVADSMITRWAPWLRPKGGVLIEDTANGATYLQIRGKEYQGVPLIAFLPNETPGADKSKAARAQYLVRAAEAGGIVLPEQSAVPFDVEEVVTWWCGFPLAKHDDDVDAASQINMRWTMEDQRSTSFFDLFAVPA